MKIKRVLLTCWAEGEAESVYRRYLCLDYTEQHEYEKEQKVVGLASSSTAEITAYRGKKEHKKM